MFPRKAASPPNYPLLDKGLRGSYGLPLLHLPTPLLWQKWHVSPDAKAPQLRFMET